jgi:hypothetical protein
MANAFEVSLSKAFFYRQPDSRCVRFLAAVADNSAPSRNTAAE